MHFIMQQPEQETGGGAEVLAIIAPQDQTHWLGVAENREEAREQLRKISRLFKLMKEELKLEAEWLLRR